MRHLWLVEKVWFRAKIDLKKDLSRWKRRYTTLAKFYAPGSLAPRSVNVDNFNFSRPYVVTANKHVDFHTRVVRLKEDFWMFCKVWSWVCYGEVRTSECKDGVTSHQLVWRNRFVQLIPVIFSRNILNYEKGSAWLQFLTESRHCLGEKPFWSFWNIKCQFY